MIVATAGHVDHGKTAIIKALTGVETDRLPEEKARGVSIELGFAYMPLANGEIAGFVDVPGHEKFIRNMLAGVASIDAALLAVAADDGVMPQTREHVAVLDLLTVSRGVVALTKTDLVDDARIAEVKREISELLKGTSLEKLPVTETSAVTGQGFEVLKDNIGAIQASLARRSDIGGFRLAIDRDFSIAGAGRIVTGTVFSGRIKVGDRVVLSENGEECRIREIHVQDQKAEVAKSGDRAALNLVGVSGRIGQIRRGCWALTAELNRASSRIDVTLKVLASESRALRHSTPVHVHIGAKHTHGRIAVLEGRAIEPGETARVQLVTDEPICTVYGDHVILRDQAASRTIAGGHVVDPFSPARGRSRSDRLELIQAMDQMDPAEALKAMLEAATPDTDLKAFALARNLGEAGLMSLLADFDVERIKTADQDLCLLPVRYADLKASILAHLQSAHEREPHLLGPEQRALLRAFDDRVSKPFYERAVAELITEEKVMRRAGLLHLPEHRPQPTSGDQRLWQKTEPLLRNSEDGTASVQPPVFHALADELKLTADEVTIFMNRAADLGWVVPVAKNRFLLTEAVELLAVIASDLAAESADGQFSVRDFRDKSGVGRNLVIQLLEFFDRQGLTRRSGDLREMIGKAADIL